MEKKVHDKVASLGEVLGIEATLLHPDQKEYSEEIMLSVLKGRLRSKQKHK